MLDAGGDEVPGESGVLGRERGDLGGCRGGSGILRCASSAGVGEEVRAGGEILKGRVGKREVVSVINRSSHLVHQLEEGNLGAGRYSSVIVALPCDANG